MGKREKEREGDGGDESKSERGGIKEGNEGWGDLHPD